MQANVTHFFDPATCTFSYIVRDPSSTSCAIIDAVLGYDAASGRVSSGPVDALIEHVGKHKLCVEWVLDTHIHADHLSAARYIQKTLGGQTAIGADTTRVQEVFAGRFNLAIPTDGSQYDRLLSADSEFCVGNLSGSVLQTPGHTPGCVTYLFPGMAFVGDTLFMPDYGTARTDFPGGNAATLYDSIQQILGLPNSTTLYMCHDYLSNDRSTYCNVSTVAEQRAGNIHIVACAGREEFVVLRKDKDSRLSAPKLLLPSVQFNIQGGSFPEPEANGTRYFKVPLDLSNLGTTG